MIVHSDGDDTDDQEYDAMPDGRQVVYITPDLKMAVMSDGATVPITNWVDCEGDDTDEFAETVEVVGGADGIGWFHAPADHFKHVTFH